MTPREIFEHFLPLTERLAKAFYSRRQILSYEEVLAAARGGLWESALRYAHLSGNELEWSTIARVRGAIIDECRARDPFSRRSNQESGKQYSLLYIDSLGSTDGIPEFSVWENPDEDLAQAARVAAVRACAETLPPRQRAVALRLLDGERQCDIVKAMGISEPRVSQLALAARTAIGEKLRRSGEAE